MNSKEYIKAIILDGTAEEKRDLFRFNKEMPRERIKKKFKLFGRGLFPRYYKYKSPEFHDEMIDGMIASYYGEHFLNIAFRGSAKTSLKKLFDVFVLLNDEERTRKYIKVLTKDGKNSRQIVTDVYNLIVEVKDIYGDVFEKEGDLKREETMTSITMRGRWDGAVTLEGKGVKYAAGTVGQTQRGHVQDAYRPDWVWFEDVETRDTIRSMVVTQAIIGRISEAIDGLSKGGSYMITANYISDQGVIQWFINKASVKTNIVPLLRDASDNSSASWKIYTPEDVAHLKKEADDFFGEYQCDPKRSENKFFDILRIEADLKLCMEPVRESAGVKYWASYLPHHRYAQGSDHSEGKGLDSNTLVGFDFTQGEQVYSYASNEIAPDLSAFEFARVGAEFGNCLYAPEVNNKCGGIVITSLRQAKYPKIFTRQKQDSVEIKNTDKLGWETNSSTKYTMFFEFRRDYNDGLIKINDKNILKEMKAYTKNDLSESSGGLITRHFDLLTAAVIAWQMRKHATEKVQVHVPTPLPNRDPYS